MFDMFKKDFEEYFLQTLSKSFKTYFTFILSFLTILIILQYILTL